MDFSAVQAEHRLWWDARRTGEAPELPALGLFKALRNFVHPLLKSRYEPQLGVDWHSLAEAAIGDMFMYLCSVSHAAELELRDGGDRFGRRTAEAAVADAAAMFSALLMVRIPATLEGAASAVLSLCDVCAVEPEVACRRALCKLSHVS